MILLKRAIARLGKTGDNAEERGRLVRVVGNVGGKILQREDGDLAKGGEGAGREVIGTPYRGGTGDEICFGAAQYRPISLLEQIARVSVPVDLGPGGNLERELACGNHNSTDKHASKVWEKAVGDAKTGRAIEFPARLAAMV